MIKTMKKPMAFVLTLVMAFGMWTGLPAMMVGLEGAAPAEVHADSISGTIDSWAELESFINGDYDGGATSRGSIDSSSGSYDKIYTISAGGIVTLGAVLQAESGDEMMIKGEDDTVQIIRTADVGSMFIATDGGVLTLEDLTIDGQETASSGAILEVYGASSVATVNNCTIKNGENTKSAGGGVYANSGTVNITGSSIKNCKVTNANAKGGGVFVDGSATANITGTAIEGCSVVGTGGANGGGMYTAENSKTNATGLVIKECSALIGGGIHNSGTMTGTGIAVSTCSAMTAAGGVYNYGGSFNAKNLEIYDCKMPSTNSGSSGTGGFVAAGGNITVNNVTITGCYALSGTESGGMYASTYVKLGGHVNITENTFKGEPSDIYISNMTTSALVISSAALKISDSSTIGAVRKNIGTYAYVLLATGGGLTTTQQALFSIKQHGHYVILTEEAIYIADARLTEVLKNKLTNGGISNFGEANAGTSGTPYIITSKYSVPNTATSMPVASLAAVTTSGGLSPLSKTMGSTEGTYSGEPIALAEGDNTIFVKIENKNITTSTNAFVSTYYKLIVNRASSGGDTVIDDKKNAPVGGTVSSTPVNRMADIGGTAANTAAVGTAQTKHWAYDAINFVLKRHWMNGITSTEFAPDEKVSRAMVAQVFGNMSNFFANGYKDSPYSDVKIGAWYGPAAAWAESTGVMTGIGGGKFAPERNMTREELAVAFYNYAKANNMTMTVTGNLSKFKDSSKVASWSKDALTWASANGIINGRANGNLDPKATATRAELASILYKFDELN